jgi:hypothetical protein
MKFNPYKHIHTLQQALEKGTRVKAIVHLADGTATRERVGTVASIRLTQEVGGPKHPYVTFKVGDEYRTARLSDIETVSAG